MPIAVFPIYVVYGYTAGGVKLPHVITVDGACAVHLENTEPRAQWACDVLTARLPDSHVTITQREARRVLPVVGFSAWRLTGVYDLQTLRETVPDTEGIAQLMCTDRTGKPVYEVTPWTRVRMDTVRFRPEDILKN